MSVMIFTYSDNLPPAGNSIYTTPGTYSWVCPEGVTSVCVVCVGGGGGGQNNGYAAAGGALAYANNIAVTPGQSYTVVVGAGGPNLTGNPAGTSGGDSYFINASTVCAGGALRTINNTAPGGVVKAGSGGAGGAGGVSRGGGAGGYSGTGGSGSTAGSGGAGGAGNNSYAGGGVGLFGEGSTGANGVAGSGGGKGGSGGTDAQNTASTGAAGIYGGGGGPNSPGGGGAVRIIWGPGKSFPYSAS